MIDRRTFLAGTAASALLGLQKQSPADDADDLQIIDCHTHFYDPTRPEGVPWPPEDSFLYRTVLPDDLQAVEKFRPIAGTVVVEASEWVEDNAWLLELAERDPFIVGIVGNLKPDAPDFTDNVARFAANPLFRGIRIQVQMLQSLLDAENLAPLQLLAEHDLMLDVNGGAETPGVIAVAAPKLPDLRFVLNHIGNVAVTSDSPPDDWRAGITAAGACENVFSKISALVEGATREGRTAPDDLEFYRPYIDVVWSAFGSDKVIYGSNWPVSDIGADYATLQRIVLEYAFENGTDATANFCSRNALKAYKYVTDRG